MPGSASDEVVSAADRNATKTSSSEDASAAVRTSRGQQTELEDLEHFAYTHTSATVDVLVSVLATCAKHLRHGRIGASPGFLSSKANLRDAFGDWLRDSLHTRSSDERPAWLAIRLQPEGVQLSLKDADALFEIVAPELRGGFDESPPVVVRLLHRMLTEGMLATPRPQRTTPWKGILERDYSVEFLGEGNALLCHHIKLLLETYDEDFCYGRVVPIVQSSGSGKSLPHRTDHKDGELGNRLRVVAWLEAVAYCLATEVALVTESYEPTTSAISLAGHFYEHLHGDAIWDPRHDRPFETSRREDLLEAIAVRCQQNCDRLAQSTDDGLDRFESTTCALAFKSLQGAVEAAVRKGQMHDDGVFILALDSAAQLGCLLDEVWKVWYGIGQRSKANADRLVLVLLSTERTIAVPNMFAAFLQPGRRAVFPPPTFTQLPHDVAYNALSAKEQDPHGKLWRALLRQLALMGRPLLGDSHLGYHQFGLYSTYSSLRPFVGDVSLWKVQGKMLMTREPMLGLPPWASACKDDGYRSSRMCQGSQLFDDVHRYLAAVYQRLPLKFIGAGLDRFVDKQMRDHMRTTADHGPRTSLLTMCTPSEPLVSIAAADLFRQPQSSSPRSEPDDDAAAVVHRRWREVASALMYASRAYYMTLGDDWGSAVRFLLTIATDTAAAQRLNVADSECDIIKKRQEMWQQGLSLDPVNLWEWLMQLFGDANLEAAINVETRIDRQPDDASAVEGQRALGPLEQFARSARLNFTHFALLPERLDSVTKDMLALWFTCHVALCADPSQEGWDMLIPVYVDPDWNGEQTQIDVNRFSHVVVQAKVRRSALPRGKIGIAPPAISGKARGPISRPEAQESSTGTPSSESVPSSAMAAEAAPVTDEAAASSARFEYLALSIDLHPEVGDEAPALRYRCDDDGEARGALAHHLDAVGLKNAFGTLLEPLGKGLLDLLRILILLESDPVKEEGKSEARYGSYLAAPGFFFTRRLKTRDG
ncbi:uncharacterized protein PSFLO_05056 [Pseudozyma flocculosa]|uniref:Uncharacterized protein n=1 Tax=Pseudozyma flocculosa TaxID=84751 RepID=A0A5C3F757_9BASI|nr:uncharacterized protein PSFLO_05056 [Pseudozyma flocculosa]